MSFEVGSLVEGRVVDIVKFGVFVKIKGGRTGLVHISQISEEFVRDVSDYVSVGADIVAKVITIDEKGRIQLSIKEVTPEEEKKFREQVSEEPEFEKQQDTPDHYHAKRSSGPPKEESFEAKLKKFMRQSEDRLVDIKRSNESKRGGGGKRKR